MEQLPEYLLKSWLCNIGFAAVYWCFLRRETFHQFNRYFLLAGIVGSLVLPLVTWSYEMAAPVSRAFTAAAVTSAGAVEENFEWSTWLIFLYAAIAFILLIRQFAGLLWIRKMVITYPYTLFKGGRVVHNPMVKTSFSVFNYIFVNVPDTARGAEKELILEHELAHVRQYHCVDLLVAQFFCIVQWFNPLAWYCARAIRQNHEYLADGAVLQLGKSLALYRAALVNHALDWNVFNLASSFVSSDRFSRITMMAKPRSAQVRKVPALLLLPLAGLFLWGFAKPVYKHINQGPKSAAGIKTLALQEADIVDPGKTVVNHPAESPARQTPPAKGVKETAKVSYNRQFPAEALMGEAQNPVKQMAVKVVAADSTSKKPKAAAPLFLLDGKEVADIEDIPVETIESVAVLKGKTAIESYGERGKNGVVLVVSKM